jgi:hypothetical protein
MYADLKAVVVHDMDNIAWNGCKYYLVIPKHNSL